MFYPIYDFSKYLSSFEPSHEIMVLFVLRKIILQTRMRSHPVGLDVVYFHTSCVRTGKALARLRGCAGSPEPSLVAYVISTIISWTGSFMFQYCVTKVAIGPRTTPVSPAHSVPIAVRRRVTGVPRGTQLCSRGLCLPVTVYKGWWMNVLPDSTSVPIMHCVLTLTTIISVCVRQDTLKLALCVMVGIWLSPFPFVLFLC